jgi:DNA-binding transcriptional MerR regulator
LSGGENVEYTIKKLGQLAGVSARTLRYYDEIGILLPARINSAGYRIYGQAEVDRLQDILFYRELGVCLDDIKNILDAPGYNRLAALQKHQEKLVDKKNSWIS